MPLRSVPTAASSRATIEPLTDSVSTSSRLSAVTTRIDGGTCLMTGAASLAAKDASRHATEHGGGEQRGHGAH